MPGMTATPTLTVVLAPASTAQMSSGKAPPPENAKLSSTVQTPSSAGSGSEAGVTHSDGIDSFAHVLQQQLAQTQDKRSPAVAPGLDLATQQLPVVAKGVDLATQSLPVVAKGVDLATRSSPAAGLGLDSTGQSTPAGILAMDPATLSPSVTERGTELIANALPATTATISMSTPTPEGTGSSAKIDKDTSKQALDDSLSSQSPYLLGLVTPPVVTHGTALPATHSTVEPDSAAQLPLASPGLTQPHLAENARQSNIADATQRTANKTAEIAVALNASADAAPTHPNHETANTQTGFDNLLAAAQAFNQGRTAGTHTPSHTTATSLPVRTPVGTNGWDREVGDKLTWMIGRQEQRAELVLNPPQLGRVEVSLTLSAGQTNAQFVSANPAVRDALEAALPRLREILADAGVNLGQAQVGADTGSNNAANQSTNNRESWDNSSRNSSQMDLANGIDNQRPVATTQWLKQANGLVDVFA